MTTASSSSSTNETLESTGLFMSDDQCTALESLLFTCCGINVLRPSSRASALNMAVLTEQTRMINYSHCYPQQDMIVYDQFDNNNNWVQDKTLTQIPSLVQGGDSDDELCGLGFLDSDDDASTVQSFGSASSDKYFSRQQERFNAMYLTG